MRQVSHHRRILLQKFPKYLNRKFSFLFFSISSHEIIDTNRLYKALRATLARRQKSTVCTHQRRYRKRAFMKEDKIWILLKLIVVWKVISREMFHLLKVKRRKLRIKFIWESQTKIWWQSNKINSKIGCFKTLSLERRAENVKQSLEKAANNRP